MKAGFFECIDCHDNSGELFDFTDLLCTRFLFLTVELRHFLLDKVLLFLLVTDVVVELHDAGIHAVLVSVDFTLASD